MGLLGLGIGTIGIMFGVLILGLGIGFAIWMYSRPKKQTWNALIWQVTGAVYETLKGSDGKDITGLNLSELKLYGTDTLIKDSSITKGITVFKLSRLQRTVRDVTPDCVTNYGEKIGKYVDILYVGDSCTVLRSAYNNETGRRIWNPMPYDRINALKNDIEVRKSRIVKKADILAQILPYAAIIVSMMFIIGIAYMSFASAKDVAKESTKQASILNEGMIKVAEINRQGMLALAGVEVVSNLGRQDLQEEAG